MKRLLAITIFLVTVITSSAQVSFRPTFRAGANISTIERIGDTDDFSAKPRLEYYYGITGTLKLSKRYSLQPEFIYSRQGADNIVDLYSSYDHSTNSYNTFFIEDSFAATYFSVGLLNRISLGQKGKLELQIGLTVDTLLSEFENRDNETDITIQLGVGYKISKNLLAEVRIKRGFLEPYDATENSPLEFLFPMFDNNYLVGQLGLAYTLDFSKSKKEE